MKKFWHADPAQINALCAEITALKPQIVLDIGGNHVHRLPVATHVVGWEGDVKLDLCRDRLPFEDQEVGYVFCRHTIEDLADPTHLLSEIRRVAKRGFIETPSPLAELSRNVDAWGEHLGYSHHRWVCREVLGKFVCIAKYPVAERFHEWYGAPLPPLETYHDWNFQFRFDGPLRYEVLQHEAGLDLSKGDARQRYPVNYFFALLGAATV